MDSTDSSKIKLEVLLSQLSKDLFDVDVDDLIRPQLPVYIIPELDSDLLPESPDADVFILDESCPYL